MPQVVREAALRHAISQLGVKEHPPGSNWGPQVSKYLAAAGIKFAAPWCAAFVTYCYAQTGYRLLPPGPASVENWERWAEKHGRLVARPFRGDIVCYDWNADNWYDHIGFVEKVLAVRWRGDSFIGWISSVEGNTSSGARGSQSNGGGVYRRRRWINRARFLRVV